MTTITTMKRYLFILLAAIAFVACSNDENDVVVNQISEIGSHELSLPVKEFFDAEIHDFALSAPTYETLFETIYEVVNSQQELIRLYTGEKELPQIDFSTRSLLIGYVVAPSTAWRLEQVELQEQAQSLLLAPHMKQVSDFGLQVLIPLYFWKFYPKLPNKPVVVSVREEK